MCRTLQREKSVSEGWEEIQTLEGLLGQILIALLVLPCFTGGVKSMAAEVVGLVMRQVEKIVVIKLGNRKLCLIYVPVLVTWRNIVWTRLCLWSCIIHTDNSRCKGLRLTVHP